MFNKGEIVHHTRDALGSILVVDYRKHRVLTFNSVFEQSKIDRRYPYLPVHEYNRAMMLPAVFANPGHVTILGLGGGVMAGALPMPGMPWKSWRTQAPIWFSLTCITQTG